MNLGLSNIIGFTGLAAFIMSLVMHRRHDDDRWKVYEILGDFLIGLANLIGAIVLAFQRNPAGCINFAFAVWMFWEMWKDWRNWKNRKKVTEALGYKTRALRDKLVKRVRELGPSPVRVPT